MVQGYDKSMERGRSREDLGRWLPQKGSSAVSSVPRPPTRGVRKGRGWCHCVFTSSPVRRLPWNVVKESLVESFVWIKLLSF